MKLQRARALSRCFSVLFPLSLLGCADGDPARQEPIAAAELGLKAAGESCSGPSECDSGFCVDSVCCTTACAGTCNACAANLKESLDQSGTCGAALAGLDPHNDCAADPVSSCGKTGSCDGKGACALYPQGVSCATQSGQTNTCVVQSSKGTICSGNGTCYTETSPSGVPCAPYACKNGACAFPCASDADCQPPNRCESGVCKAKRPNGAPCSALTECSSGNCTDGVCCDSNCSGQCVACNLAGKVGTCSVVSGDPVGGRTACEGTAPCKGTCAGDPNKCSYPDKAVACGSASCTGDTSTSAPACDGTGKCAAGSSSPCSPYGCDTGTGVCRSSCSSNADCSQGSVCDTLSGKCASATNQCKDAFTVEMPNGTTQSCSPYKCVAGKCQQQCSVPGDCAPGYECQGKVCVEVVDGGGGSGGASGGSGGGTTTGGSAGSAAGATGGASGGSASSGGADGGCGCRTIESRSSRGGLALLLVLAGLVASRRRRQPCS